MWRVVATKENQPDLLSDIQEVFDPAPTAAGWSQTLGEDAARISKRKQARVMAIFNNLVIGLVRQQGFTNLAAARRYYNGQLSAAVRLVTSDLL